MQPELFMVSPAVGYLGACSDANFDMNPTNRNEPGLAGKEAIKATGIIRETERETTNEAIQPTIAGLRVSNKCKIKNSFLEQLEPPIKFSSKANFDELCQLTILELKEVMSWLREHFDQNYLERCKNCSFQMGLGQETNLFTKNNEVMRYR